MAGLMTYGRRQFEQLDSTMRRLIPPFHTALAELTALVDADARAFEGYLVSRAVDSGREASGLGERPGGKTPPHLSGC